MARTRPRIKQRKTRRRNKTSRNQRAFWFPDFKNVQLEWMDQLLRSLTQVAPEDWLPAKYQTLLQQEAGRRRTLH